MLGTVVRPEQCLIRDEPSEWCRQTARNRGRVRHRIVASRRKDRGGNWLTRPRRQIAERRSVEADVDRPAVPGERVVLDAHETRSVADGEAEVAIALERVAGEDGAIHVRAE